MAKTFFEKISKKFRWRADKKPMITESETGSIAEPHFESSLSDLPGDCLEQQMIDFHTAIRFH